MKFRISLLLLFLTQIISAQSTTLTLDEAIQMALSQNLGLKVNQNDIKIAQNNAVKGNAGFLPNVNLVAGESPSLGYVNQKFIDGRLINRANLSNNVTAGVQLSWLLYDGKRMYLELDRLKELQSLGEINLRIRSEQIIYDVMRAYFNIVRQEELHKSLEEQMNLYEERFRIAQTRLDVGKGNQLDVLQAQTDLNVQRTNVLRQKQNIQTAKYQLNQILSSKTDPNFEIKDSFDISRKYNLAALRDDAVNKNLNVDLLKKQNGIAMLVAKQIETLRKPRVTFNSAFNIGRIDNTANQLLLNQSVGLNAGVTLTYPLYDGGNIKRQVENAKIDIESNNYRVQQLQIDLANTINTAYQSFENALAILREEEENARIARQSIDIAMERYRLSRSTVLELAQIQQVYENAIFRSVSSKFDAKMAEIDLMRISGMLTKQ